MSDAAAKLLEVILTLPDEDRIAIRDVIQDSLADDYDPEWAAELDRRWQGYISGERPGIPAEEVYRQVRERYNLPPEGGPS